MKDAANTVLGQHKAISLAELFFVELIITVDTLNEWFSEIMKPRFLEIDSVKKEIYRKENPIDQHKTTCSIYGFILDVNNGGWIDFVVKC